MKTQAMMSQCITVMHRNRYQTVRIRTCFENGSNNCVWGWGFSWRNSNSAFAVSIYFLNFNLFVSHLLIFVTVKLCHGPLRQIGSEGEMPSNSVVFFSYLSNVLALFWYWETSGFLLCRSIPIISAHIHVFANVFCYPFKI